jgi:hypothetical protein
MKLTKLLKLHSHTPVKLHLQKCLMLTQILAALLLSICMGRAGTFTVTSTADSDPGSLRQAILDANADSSTNDVFIEFNIPGSGVQTIAPFSPLPVITRSVSIDGYTQPGTSPNTLADGDNAVLLIELSGVNLSGTLRDRGLSINANGCTIRGLVINRFTFHDTGGIWMETSDDSVIEGNFIGTDATGNAA